MSNHLKSIQSHRSLTDVVFERLCDAIIDGQLEAGQWLRQEALAQELGVSQMPVREALKRLVAEGLAVRIPYKGVKVVEFSPEDIVDICTVRLVLEGLAVRLATPLITAKELEQLKENLRETERYTGQDQMARRRQLNTDFHLSICQASGRQYLVRLLEELWGWFPSVMLYEGITGRPPFRADSLTALLLQHVRARAPTLIKIRSADSVSPSTSTERGPVKRACPLTSVTFFIPSTQAVTPAFEAPATSSLRALTFVISTSTGALMRTPNSSARRAS